MVPAGARRAASPITRSPGSPPLYSRAPDLIPQKCQPLAPSSSAPVLQVASPVTIAWPKPGYDASCGAHSRSDPRLPRELVMTTCSFLETFIDEVSPIPLSAAPQREASSQEQREVLKVRDSVDSACRQAPASSPFDSSGCAPSGTSHRRLRWTRLGSSAQAAGPAPLSPEFDGLCSILAPRVRTAGEARNARTVPEESSTVQCLWDLPKNQADAASLADALSSCLTLCTGLGDHSLDMTVPAMKSELSEALGLAST